MHIDPPSSTTQSQDVQNTESLAETPATTSPTSTPKPERFSIDDGPSKREDAKSNDDPKPPKPSVPLRRSIYMVFLTLLYGAAALWSWVIICILTYRPIGGIGYGLDEFNDILNHPHLDYTVPGYLDVFFARSERYLRAARIVQSVVSVLTIPLTSAVCSQAAVVYIQRKRGKNRPTLRQSMALADRGWSDIAVLKNLIFGGWNKYMSSLLLFAMFLHLLGFVISPVQQIFLSFKTIKRVGFPVDLGLITDFTDMFPYPGFASSDNDDGFYASLLRATLTSTINTDVQPRLWSSGTGTVTLDYLVSAETHSSFETKSQNSLVNMSTISDPFWAELPAGTNTGLLRQFAPRINSTATWEDNSAGVLPEDCNIASDAFYLRYEYASLFQYNIEICMPGNMSQSPWKNQNSRQDITEELYLKMNFSGDYNAGISEMGAMPGTYSRKLTLHTTTGYFELPNYMNGQVPGPLLDEIPSGNRLNARDLDNSTAWTTLYATTNMSSVFNKGPLLNIAMALFGEGSFVDVEHTVLAAYAQSSAIYPGCITIVPFISLLKESESDSVAQTFNPCLDGTYLGLGGEPNPRGYNEITMHAIIAAYFWLFSGDPLAPLAERVQNAFASAAFLTNDMLMTNALHGPSLDISFDMGADVEIPQISRAGIIFISVLLGLDLACLLALALYSAWIPRWTETLDAFAMLRIGASISEKVPLLAARHVGRIKTLDETPGWIGSASGGEIGELCLGGERPLRKTKRYGCYDTDVAQATAMRKPSGAIRREGYSLGQGESA